MKVKMKFIFVVLLVVSGILLSFLLSYQPRPGEFVANRSFSTGSDLFFDYETTRCPSKAGVSAVQPSEERLTIGVVVDPWNLDFGIIPAGNNFGTRIIELTNKKEKDVKVNFKVYGNISPFVNFSKNNFILHPKENATVEVHFYAASAKVGNYSGEIDIIIQRPKYDFIYYFWM